MIDTIQYTPHVLLTALTTAIKFWKEMKWKKKQASIETMYDPCMIDIVMYVRM